MIFQVNLRQQLNGSNKFNIIVEMNKLFYLLCIFSELGCSTTSKTAHVWPNDNQVIISDTLVKNIPEEKKTDQKPDDKKSLHVALMLPFYTNEIEYDSLGIEIVSNTEKSNLAIQYLRGVQMALDSLDQAGIKIEMNIFDTQKDTNRVINFMNSSFIKNAEIIIGPISNTELIVAGKLIDTKHQVIFSPLSSSQNLASSNSGFVLANAGLKTHCEQLAKFINAKYPNKKIIILYRRNEGENQYATYFKSFLKSKPIELTEKSDSSFYHTDDFFTTIDNNIVIIPSFDEEFVNVISKKLFELTENYKITLFGMPTWTEMETLRFDYLQKLNTHITSSFFADDSLKTNIAFRTNYKSNFSSRPSEYSYQGYNLVLLIGTLWKQYGDNWYNHLQQPLVGLGINYNFQSVILNTQTTIDFIENKHVYILSYKDNILFKEK